MKEAVIVATARTPIGRAFRGSLNNTKSPALTAHVLRHAAVRAGIEGAEVDDVIIGSALAAGTAGMNVARMAALAAGFPVSVPGQTLDRQCASGLMAVATGAKQVIVDGMQVVITGGQENISAVQNPYFEWAFREQDPQVTAHGNAYMGMLKTAEFVARKYKIPRKAQDAYALESQRRTAAGSIAAIIWASTRSNTTSMAAVSRSAIRTG